MTIELSTSALSILAEGRQVHVAVASRRGPHVTPELYAWWDDRLWFATATDTLKARVLRRDPSLGAVVSGAGRSVLLAGEVEVFDPLDVGGLLGGAGRLPGAAQALARFTVRNAPDLMAFGRDLLTGQLGLRLPPLRVLVALTPTAALTLENEVVTWSGGTWSSVDAGDVDSVDSPSTDLPVGGLAAVVAVDGPVAAPARWFADDEQVLVAPPLLALFPADRFELGVVVDDYMAPGPAAKQGTLLRGTGRRIGGTPGLIQVDLERQVEWDGVATSSTPLS
jgi:hypothetical protein